MINPATLITDHLETWSSAIKAKSSAGRGSGKKREFYGIKKLRELIMELAVRGLLVQQDPNDESASILLKRVALKKAKLIKEGQIGKQKPLAPVSDDEIQFPLPNGWEWAKLGNLVEMYNGRAFKASEWAEDGVPIVRIQNLNDSAATFNYFTGELGENNRISDGTFLISWSGTPGTSFGAFIWRRGEAALNQHINKCVFHDEATNLEFMQLVVTGQMNHFISMAQGGVGLKHVTKGTLNNAVLGIPPLAEQHRIVAKVDELMALCNQLELRQEDSVRTHGTLVQTLLGALTAASERGQFAQAWQRIASHFDTLFTTESSIDQLKQTILQLAVMGKLVEQDPKEEVPAKNPARDNAALFEIPEKWIWTQLCQLAEINGGFAFKSTAYSDDGMRVVRISDFDEFGFKDHKVVRHQFSPELQKFTVAEDNILMAMTGGTVGKSYLVGMLPEPMVVNQRVATIKVSKKADPRYIDITIKSEMTQGVIRKAKNSTNDNISMGDIKAFPIPLPPLAEQHRIVAKVDELMTLCDRLNTSLQNAQVTQLDLADSLVEAAIG